MLIQSATQPSSAQTVSPQPADIQKIQQLVADDLNEVNALIQKQLHSRLPIIHSLGSHITQSGGKRLRPLLVLLLSRALGYKGAQHHLVAAIVELIHTATLLHDDVVDNATLRRNKASAQDIWGSHASVLVGDFLYSRAFQMIVQTDSLKISDILADTTNTIAEGEVHQLINQNKLLVDEAVFFEVIRCKTAVLFEASTHICALLVNAPQDLTQALRDFGNKLGIGFQLIDDYLDYADTQSTGKHVGNDLKEGKTTFPLLCALRSATPEQRKQFEQAMTSPNISPEEVAELIEIVRQCGGLEETRKRAGEYLDEAEQILDEHLPPSPYRDALRQLLRFLLLRTC